MARLRTLKPEFFTHELLAELGPLHRLLYAGLWCHADREGRLEDRPRYLKTVILPYDACDVDRMLSDLEGKGFIRRYEGEGKRCIYIPTFHTHQNPHFKEKPSVLPAPPVGAATNGPRLETPPQGTAITHASESPVQAPDKPWASPVQDRVEPSSSRVVLSIGLRSGLGSGAGAGGTTAAGFADDLLALEDIRAKRYRSLPIPYPIPDFDSRWQAVLDGHNGDREHAFQTFSNWLEDTWAQARKPPGAINVFLAPEQWPKHVRPRRGLEPPEDLCSICHESTDVFRSNDVLVCYACNASGREAAP